MKKKIIFISILSLAGIVLAGIATKHSLNITQFGLQEPAFCTFNDFVNCDVVSASSYAFLFGVPNAWWGLLFYLWNLIIALSVFAVSDQKSLCAKGVFAGWLALFYSLYMAYLSIIVLNALCLTCVGMYLVNILLLLGWIWGFGQVFPGLKELKVKIVLPILTFIFVFGIGGFGMYQASASPVDQSKLKMIVNFHFRQSEYDLAIPEVVPSWGNKDAKIVIAEFSDFQCPHCKEAAFRIKPNLHEFKDQVRLVYFNYPLDSSCNPGASVGHRLGCLAARASMCAHKKGVFWKYHDDLFRNQRKLNRNLMIKLAKKNGMDEVEFQQCIDSKEIESQVKEQVSAGNHVHIVGTPTVLINNRRVKHWRFPEILRAIIKEELKRN